MRPAEIAWADYAPDMPDYSPGFTDAIKNVIPLAIGYAPMPSWQQQGSATVGAEPMGGVYVRKADSSADVYVGTVTALYKFDNSTTSMSDVTRLSGGDYAGSIDWSFAQFGTRLIACNGTDATQYIDVDSGTNFAALSNAPIAKTVAAVGDFLFFGALSTDIKAIQWSGVNDSEYYTAGERGSDTQSFSDGGNVQALLGAERGCVIFQDDKVRFAERTSDQAVFIIRVIHEKIGCFAAGSVAGVRNDFFWYDQGGFYQGFDAIPIGANRVNDYVRQNTSTSARKLMRSAVDPIRKIVWWSVKNTSGDYIMLGYNWITQKWTIAELDVALIFQAIPPGYTFDTWDDLGATFDDLPYTFDSSVWAGDNILVLGGVTSAGAFGYFDSTNLEATLESHDIEMNKGGYTFINALRMVVDVAIASVTGKVGTRQFHGDTLTWSSSSSADSSTGRMWFNHRGFTHRFRCVIAAGATWYNTTGCQAYGRAAGWR